MKLNIYLCKTDAVAFEDCLRPTSPTRQYKLVGSGTPEPDVSYGIYLVIGEAKKPSWLTLLQAHIDPSSLNDITNRNCSVVVLLRLQTSEGHRIFAVSGGFGYHILRKEIVESSFGLLTTLNSIDPKRIKAMDTRNLGVQTRQRREASNIDTEIGEFGFEFDTEILQVISGAAQDSSLGTRLGGADSLHLTTNLAFADIPAKCRAVFDRYKSDDYKSKFEFVDHIRHEKDQAVVDVLDKQLVTAINGRSRDLKIAVAYPDQIDYDRAATFRFSGLGRSGVHRESDFEDVDLESVYKYLAGSSVDIHMLKDTLRVLGLDPDTDMAVTPQESLYSYLVFETEWQGCKYVLSNKKWYRIDDDYVSRLRESLDAYVTYSTAPTLKDWPTAYHEGQYNNLYLSEPEYLHLDRANFTAVGFGRGKVEVADLFHRPTKKLFFVKKLNRSATLSHLFSQATVSADLLKDSVEYRRVLANHIEAKWPGTITDDLYLNSVGLVYTIGTARPEPLVEVLPIFSRINLLKHIRTLRRQNWQVELARVALS